jgi:WD40 repeat protein
MSEITNSNQDSFRKLTRAICYSEGTFSLIFVRCNYAEVRDNVLKMLRQEIENVLVISLPKETHKVFDLINEEVGDKSPSSVIILDIEKVDKLDDLLAAINGDRDRFREFGFPLVCWLNDFLLTKLTKLAPDFKSFGSIPIYFFLSEEELVNFLGKFADAFIDILLNRNVLNENHLEKGDDKIEDITGYSLEELEAAIQDLKAQDKELPDDITAALELAYGRDRERNKQISPAINHYQNSLQFWTRIGNLECQGLLELHLGLAYGREALLKRSQEQDCWQQQKIYLHKSMQSFKQSNRADLAVKVIGELGKVLLKLKAWDDLKALTEGAMSEYTQQQNNEQKAQIYGFLARIALEKEKNPTQAKELVTTALTLLPDYSKSQSQYLYLQAEAERRLGEQKLATEHLYEAKQKSSPEDDTLLYLEILNTLRQLHYDNHRYKAAFEVKQERQAVEAQYGFRAFIGATSLLCEHRIQGGEREETIAQAIEVSGRKKDILALVSRLSRPDGRLTIVHGPSGVGKSSLLNGGLVPYLKRKTFFISALPVRPIPLRKYNKWLADIAESLSLPSSANINSTEPIIEHLRQNIHSSQKNKLLTVFIFDQFEEFFFNVPDVAGRTAFFNFLIDCMKIPFVYIILSLREDYLHYLLDGERLLRNIQQKEASKNDMPKEEDTSVVSLQIINDILSQKNRYELKNFSPLDARTVIEELAKRSQFDLEPELVNKLVTDLTGDLGEIRPIELQIVGAQLQEDSIKTLEAYQNLGEKPKEKIVQKYLDKVVSDCGEENRKAADLVLFLLTDDNDTRPLKTENDLKESLKNLSLTQEVEHLDEVLDIFVKSGLVMLLPERPAERYQLVHDYLVTLIRAQKKQAFEKKFEEEQAKRLKAETALSELKKKEVELQRANEATEKANQATEIAEKKKEEAERIQQDALQQQRKAEQGKRNLKKGLIVGAVGLIVGAVIACVAILSLNKASQNNRRYFQENFLESNGNKLWRDSSKKLNESFTEAIKKGKELKNLYPHNDISNYKVYSPVAALNHTLKGISYQKNYKSIDRFIYQTSYSDQRKELALATNKGLLIWKDPNSSDKDPKRLDDKTFTNVAYSPKSGQWLAAISKEEKGQTKQIYLWNLQKENPVPIEKDNLNNEKFLSITFSPDEKWLVASSSLGKVYFWKNIGKGSWKFDPSKTISMDKSITASDTDKLTVLQVPSFEDKSERIRINDITFKDDNILAVASASGWIVMYDINKGNKLVGKHNFQASVSSVSFSKDGRWLVTGLKGHGFIGILDLKEQENNKSYLFKAHDASINNVAFLDDSKLATSSLDSTKLWQLQSIDSSEPRLTILSIFQGVRGELKSLSLIRSSENPYLITGSALGYLQVFDLNRALRFAKAGHNNTVYFLAFQNENTLVSGSADRTARLWKNNIKGKDYDYIEQKPPIKNLSDTSNEPKSIEKIASIHPTEPHLIIGVDNDNDNYFHIIDLSTKKYNKKLSEQLNLAINNHMIIGSKDNSKKASASALSFNSDGTKLAFVSDEGRLFLVDYPSMELSLSIKPNCYREDKPVISIAFSKDDKYLAMGDTGGNVCIFDIKNKTYSYFNSSSSSYVSSLEFSPHKGQEDFLLVASGDNFAYLWDLKDNDKPKPKLIVKFEGHNSPLEKAIFSPSNPKLIATASQDNTARLWAWQENDDKGKEILKFSDHTTWVRNLVFRKDGKLLVTGSDDFSIRFWDIPTNIGELIDKSCDELMNKKYLENSNSKDSKEELNNSCKK